MKNIIYFLCTAATLASCSSSFSIHGTSDVQNLDGHMLYLKAMKGDNIKSLDSCDVVHGQFDFRGNLDTVKVGTLVINDESVMPVVLEEGDIQIQFNNAKQTCSGTPLNDKLSDFIEKYNQLSNQMQDIQHMETEGMMNGKDMNVVYSKMQVKAAKLNDEFDKCVTSFIEDNFDNVLGPFVFQMATSDMEVPMTNAWIDALMAKATDAFKNDRYVKDFMDAANRNQAIMTGMEAPVPSTPAAPPTQPGDEEMPAPPTPNQMASPQQSK